MSNNESRLRERIARFGELLFLRGYGCGSSGNISVRLEDGILVTPTNSCLGLLEPERIAKLDDQTAFSNLAKSKKRKDEAAAQRGNSVSRPATTGGSARCSTPPAVGTRRGA